MKSPAEYFKLKVLGKITVKEMNGTMTFLTTGKTIPHTVPSTTYEFIKEDDSCFIANHWSKEHKKQPLILAKSLIEKVERY